MEWVAIDVNIAGDPAVHRIAAALRLRVMECVGYLTVAFGGMAQHADTGDLSQVPDTLLETWAMWTGKRGAFAEQFRAELCGADGVVKAWEKYNGAAIREAKASLQRSRDWRETRRRERAEKENGTALRTAHRTAFATPNGTEFRTGDEPRTERRTVPNRTVPNLKARAGGDADASPPREKRVRPAAPPPWAALLSERWISLVGRTTPLRIQQQLGSSVAVHGESAVLSAIDTYSEVRLKAGKDRKLEWFAEDVAGWVKRAAEDEEPLVVDGWLSPHGERVTRP